MDTLEYARAHKDDKTLLSEILAKAALRKGLNHREAAVLLLCEDETVTEQIAAVYGAIALITGIADIVFYAKMERRTGFGPVVSLVTGILSVIAGILILFNLSAGAWLVATLFPIWFLAHCISRLAQLPFTRMTSGSAAFWFSLVLNILGLVLGVLLLASVVLGIAIGPYSQKKINV